MDPKDFFAGVFRWDWPVAGGLRVPLFFASLESVAAVFTADSAQALALLPDERMKPVEVMPGRCLFTVAALHYRDGDLGAYHEMSLALPISFGSHPLPALDAVRHGFSRAVNAFIWQLPVTTERARDAGVQLAGFPKVLAELQFERDGSQLQCTWLEQGRSVIRLGCDVTDDAGDRVLKLRGYTMKDGIPLVSNLLVRQTRFRDQLQRGMAALSLGEGPVADTLRSLRLSERPIASQCCSQAQAMLFFPRNVMDD